jgi:hypothetical protein
MIMHGGLRNIKKVVTSHDSGNVGKINVITGHQIRSNSTGCSYTWKNKQKQTSKPGQT